MSMKPNRSRILVIALALCCLAVAPVFAQPFPPGPADEVTMSLGRAIISVVPAHQGLVNTRPGWNPTNNTWTTPLMYDPATVIGRSDPFRDASARDINGMPVGSAGTIVSDASFTAVPTLNFTEGPPGTAEIHTEIYKLNMQDLCFGQFRIRGGTGMGVGFPSFGEVEALPGSADFPAESFFDMFIELDTPFYGGTTLYNRHPLLVVNPNLTSLPPVVVYIHGETPAVPIFFKTGAFAGQLFGYLRMAGHGVGGQCEHPCGHCPAAEELDAALEDQPLMECSQCDDNGNPDVTPVPTEPKPTSPGGIQN